MAAGTVAYTDTTGNMDYLGMIANQIGRRLKEASDMASNERAFAEKKAEEGGTSLSEAGIGKGYFFRRALGSRFGGDRIARTKGRMGMGGAGTDPTGNFKSRFRGGFDYNVTNQIEQSTLPLSNALVVGLRGVENGLTQISQSLNALSRGMNDLARAQQDAAKQAILNGAFMQAFLNHMQREAARQRARSEERGLERRGFLGGSGGGGTLGGGNRGMINVTPPTPSLDTGLDKGDIASAAISVGTNRKVVEKTPKIVQKLAQNSPTIRKAIQKTPGLRRLLPAGGKVTKGLLQGAKGGTRAIAKASKFLGITPSPKLIANTKKIAKLSGPPVRNLMSAMLGAKRMNQINPRVNASVLMGIDKKMGEMSLEQLGDFINNKSKQAAELGEDVINLKMYGQGAKTSVDDAARLYGRLLDGTELGRPLSPKMAEELMKNYVDPSVYNKFSRAAKEPIEQAMKGTFTHKILKAPGVPKAIASGGTKAAAKTGGKALLRSGLKKIPVIAGLAGIAFGIQRAMEGDLLGAGLEITSGILGATGVGGGLGLAIDGYLLGRDMGMMPLKDGILANAALPAIFGEAGKEAAVPLEGSEGEIAGSVFGNASAESLVNFFAKRTNKGALPKSLLELYPNLDPTNARDYMKLKRLMREADLAYARTNDPNEMSNRLNNNSAQTSMGNLFMPTTIVNNNYSTIAAGNGGSSDDSGGNSSFPDTLKNYVLGFSLFSK